MAIPRGIKVEHVQAAMRQIQRDGVPPGADSTRYDVIDPETGKALPPKLVLSIAAELATGKRLLRTAFSGGIQTNEPLEALGFDIVEKGSAADVLTVDDIVPGQTLTNNQIVAAFKVGNSGGMRWSSTVGALVLVADHTKALYDDRWDGNVLHYTGMGRLGDQKLTGQNLRLAEQGKTATPVHLFEVFKPNQYEYRGEVELAAPMQEMRQPDDNGVSRNVFVFPLRLLGTSTEALPKVGEIESMARERQRSMRRKTVAELLALAATGGAENPGKRSVIAVQYQRNDAITVLVKRLANGICDLCEKPAPFNTSEGPYLECHHVQRLADGGPDALQNVVALCPNCHRRMHLAAGSSEKQKLLKRVQARQAALLRSRISATP